MTILTLYRAPRRIVRKLFKPALLWLNAYRVKQSELEIERLRQGAESMRRAECREYRYQIRLAEQRREIRGWK